MNDYSTYSRPTECCGESYSGSVCKSYNTSSAAVTLAVNQRALNVACTCLSSSDLWTTGESVTQVANADALTGADFSFLVRGQTVRIGV